MALRELPDRRVRLAVDADRDELDQPVARLVEHAERAVRGIDRLGCGLDDRVQDGVQVEVGPDREDRIEQPFELPFDLPVIAAFHPVTVRGRSPAPRKGTGDPRGRLGGDDQVVACVLRRWTNPRTTSTAIIAAAMKAPIAAIAGDHADGRPGEGGQQQASQRLAPEERVPLGRHSVGLGLQLVDGSLRLAVVDRFGDGGLGGPLDGAEVGVGLAVGDPFEVPVDEAGVGLGLRARGDLLAGVLDEVRSSLGRSATRRRGTRCSARTARHGRSRRRSWRHRRAGCRRRRTPRWRRRRCRS